MSETDQMALSKLEALVSKAGSQSKAARKLGITPQMVNMLIKGRKRFSDAILSKLGLRRVVSERIEGK